MRARTVVAAVTILALVVLGNAPASAASPTLAQITMSGLHNSYEKSAFAHFPDALATGTGMVEIDVWTTLGAWTVAHDHPFWNNNNCTAPSGAVNQRLPVCVDNIAAWHQANPDHPPLLIKLELKLGFWASNGLGPAELDHMFTSRLGSAMYRPADLMGGNHPTPDAAARAGAWASADELRGRVVLLVLKGNAEIDPLPTDVEYARHMIANPDTAVGFPFVHNGIATTDPRTRYDEQLRPWFVVFDGPAARFAELTAAQRAFYTDNNYLLVTTNAHAVAPQLDRLSPTTQQAVERLELLGCLGSSIVSSDWYRVPDWHRTAPRGC